MPIQVMLHIANEEPILGEIDEMPVPSDNVLVVNNPRRRNGKELHYLAENVTRVAWPWTAINFLEFLPTERDEDIIGFVRE